ncbi:M13 family metallopeptidase [Acetobacteraceae bacterium]|nr:M13 family metallopeptidase [Acetobacteraceae bacterium]
MNSSVFPGNDFFEYTNGTYIKNLKIPEDMSSYGAFNILRENSLKNQKAILEKLSTKTLKKDSDEEKLNCFYQSFLDEVTIEKLGIKPFLTKEKSIKNISQYQEFASFLGASNLGFNYSPFVLGIEQNQEDPTQYMFVLDQGVSAGVSGGLGLPDARYYTDPALVSKKKAYENYAKQMLSFLKWQNPDLLAKRIVNLETEIAGVLLPREQTRDAIKMFNPMTVSQLKEIAPSFDWNAYFKNAGVDDLSQDNKIFINVREPAAITAMSKIFAKTPIDTLKAWVAFRSFNKASPYLSSLYSNSEFKFNSQILAGVKQKPARWKLAINASNDALGWALGALYSEAYFSEESKKEVIDLIQQLKETFHYRLEHNSWMDEETKKSALKKLDHFDVQVGYPEKWRTYEGLEIKKGDLYGNVERAIAFDWRYQLNKLGKKVDRSEWEMFPQTVNAYNNPTMNEIVFPAAILQPPFFNPKADMAINYGAIGGVIGHEMTHAFDDQGRHYDFSGKLNDWWSKKSAENFEKQADRLISQYSQIELMPGLHINGKTTLGENIADLGGLTLALEAYKNQAQLKGISLEQRLDGWSGTQRVFLGWAQIWREKIRPDALRQLTLTNEHAAPVVRVNMPCHNIKQWLIDFNVTSDQVLFLPENERIEIW